MMTKSVTASGGPTARPKVAIFTGAGASKAFGYPLTRELLPRILNKLSSGTLFRGDHDEQQAFSQALSKLFPGLFACTGEVPLWITDILSLLDQAIVAGTALHPELGLDEIRNCRDRVGRALYDALDVPAPAHDEQQRFHEWLATIAHNSDLGVISTNYDLTIDQPILNSVGVGDAIATEVDFGFDWRDVADGSIHTRPRSPRYRILKLHGSLNWLKCELCEHVYVNARGKIAHQAFRRVRSDGNTCHCGHWPLSDHLVAPSLVRDVRDPTLLSIWKSALEFLRDAETWYFVGYSLPSEDVAIRSLLLRAFHTAKKVPNVSIVQYGTTAEAQYRVLFPRCTYFDAGLERFLDSVTAPATTT